MSKLRLFLLVWVLFSFVATVFGGYTYIQESEDTKDVSVSSGTTCQGGCLYYGVASYPLGTACRGLKPGDPDGAGGTWKGNDLQEKCYICQAGGFVETNINNCSHCYAHTCLKEGGPAQYPNGSFCAYATGTTYGIVQCKAGKWVPPSTAKCTGWCRGDGAGSVYDKGHTCLDPTRDDLCWVCENAGNANLVDGGFKSYAITNAKCAPVKPAENVAKCPAAKCVGDVSARTYTAGELCHTTQEVGAADYGTYKCLTNGTWQKLGKNESLCEAQNKLYKAGEKIEYLNECYQCTVPGQKTLGGFEKVAPSLCGITTGTGDPSDPVKKNCYKCESQSKTCNLIEVEETTACDGSNGIYSDQSQCTSDCQVVTQTKQCYTCNGDTKTCNVQEVSSLTDCNGGFNGLYSNEASCTGACTVATETKTCYECNSVSSSCEVRNGITSTTACDGTNGLYDSENSCKGACGKITGGDEIHPHAKADACLGDLNSDGEVNLDDFARFAGLFGKTLTGDERNLDIVVEEEGEFIMNISDLATFARNYGKSKSDNSCAQRGFILVVK